MIYTEKEEKLISKLADFIEGETYDTILKAFSVIILSIVNDQYFKVESNQREEFLVEWCNHLLATHYLHNTRHDRKKKTKP